MSAIRVIGREDIQKVFTVTAALRAVESAYAGKSAGTGRVWPMVFHEFDPGHADLDIKSGDLESAGVYGLKVVSWYDSNAEKALPALFGTSLPLRSCHRRAEGAFERRADHSAAHRRRGRQAIGAKYLARKDAKTLTIVGCGELCPYLAAAGLAAMPSLETRCISRTRTARRKAAERLAAVTAASGRAAQGVRAHARTAAITAAADAAAAVGASDIVFTATCAKAPVVKERVGQARYACKLLHRRRPAGQAGGRIGGARPRRRLRRRYGAVLRRRRMRAAAQRGRPPRSRRGARRGHSRREGRADKRCGDHRFRLHRHRPAGHCLCRSHSQSLRKAGTRHGLRYLTRERSAASSQARPLAFARCKLYNEKKTRSPCRNVRFPSLGHRVFLKLLTGTAPFRFRHRICSWVL